MKEGLTSYLYNQLGPIIRTSRDIFDLPKRKHPINDFTENDVFAIQEVALCCSYEKLRQSSAGQLEGIR